MTLNCGWPFPDLQKPQPLFKIRSQFVIPMVGTFSKIILGWCNNIEAHNAETLRTLVASRGKRPLITVANHYSCLDDPGLWALLRWRDVWSANTMRWSLAAHDICFTNCIHSWFFSSGKCVPVIRGGGVYQKGMDFCLERLKEGGWVHIFPEGKVNMTLEHLRHKWGVGRLIYESPVTPIVLPFCHVGMEAVLPNHPPYIPRLNKKVTVLVGEPIDLSGLLTKLRSTGCDDVTARKAITDVIQEELRQLRIKAELLHKKRLQNS